MTAHRQDLPSLQRELRFCLRSLEACSETFDHPALPAAVEALAEAVRRLGTVPLNVPRRGGFDGEEFPDDEDDPAPFRDPDKDPAFR